MKIANYSLEGSLDGASAIAVAVYLGAVIYQGNTIAFGKQALNDAPGFLEFVVAVYLITVLVNFPGPIGVYATAFVALALLGLFLQMARKDNFQPLIDFGSGKSGLFETVAKIAAGNL